jgi:riboflavin kinase/FMN adenylyltransferase
MKKISGIVVHGDGYGRKLGYPTANLDIRCPSEMRAGVYAGVAYFDDQNFKSGILVNPSGKIEAHLIDFDGDLYGKTLTLHLEKFLRDFQRFKNEEDLKKQIGEDLKKC